MRFGPKTNYKINIYINIGINIQLINIIPGIKENCRVNNKDKILLKA